MAWRPPQPPPVEKMPPKRGPKRPRYGVRILVGIVGAILVVSAGIGVWRALNDRTGTSTPFGALAALLPAVVMIRYAFTGVIKVN